MPDLPFTACDVEPIHIPGLIQPHGVLLVLRRAGNRTAVVAASANAGGDGATDPAAYLDAASRDRLDRALASPSGVADLPLGVLRDRAGLAWDATLRLHSTAAPEVIPHPGDRDLALLELEPAGAAAAEPRLLLERLNQGLVAIQTQTAIAAACRAAVAALASVSGFDRVMAYRFLPDLSGEVLAESLRRELPVLDPAQPASYLGLRFPASDIPAQTRTLYHSVAVRLIPDALIEPAPLLRLDGSDRAIDLSRAVLRGVAPVHLAYLANMGVRASMSIAIRDGCGSLWGLFACHHLGGPLQVGPEARLAAEILARALSWRIVELEGVLVETRLACLARASAPMLAGFSRSRPQPPPMDRWPVLESLSDPRTLQAAEGLHELLAACEADALVIWPRLAGVEPLRAGAVPGPVRIELLCSWLDEQARLAPQTAGAPEWLLSTQVAPELLPPELADALRPQGAVDAAPHDALCGLLAVRLPGAGWLLLLRQELRRLVHWAGNPEKQVAEAGDDAARSPGGLLQLSPRASFAAWTQEVAGQSAPWTEADRKVALALRDAVGAVLLAHSTEIARGNEELRRRSDETRFFADAAAHDLREPLWQIRVLSELVGEGLEDMPVDQPPPPAVLAELHQMTQSVVASANRMHAMIEELSRLAIAGHQPDRTQAVSLREVAAEALEDIRQGQSLPREQAASLPAGCSISLDGLDGVRLRADRGQVRRVFQNLFSNAIKYRHPDRPLRIAAEALPGVQGLVRVQVSDNGVGFDPAHATQLFQPFRRFPNRAAAATTGLGLGLAICQRIVVAHGGGIEASARVEGGARFCFTLAEPDTAPAEEPA